MSVSHEHAPLPQASPDGPRINVEPVANPCERPACRVEPDGLVDLLRAESLVADRDIRFAEQLDDARPANAEVSFELA